MAATSPMFRAARGQRRRSLRRPARRYRERQLHRSRLRPRRAPDAARRRGAAFSRSRNQDISATSKPAATQRAKRPHPEEMRRQPTFKLPIEGGPNQKAPKQKTAAEPGGGADLGRETKGATEGLTFSGRPSQGAAPPAPEPHLLYAAEPMPAQNPPQGVLIPGAHVRAAQQQLPHRATPHVRRGRRCRFRDTPATPHHTAGILRRRPSQRPT
jgi:hypothetical protein